MATLIELVKDLRERTNAGFADCKKALEASEMDIEKAIDWLREKGIAKQASKAGRIAAEGLAKIVVDGNTAVIVEVNSETDFSAKNELFKNLVEKIAQTVINEKPADNEAALACPCGQGTLSEEIATVSFQTGEKMTLRRFEVIEKNDDQIFGTYTHFDGKTAVVVVLDGSDEAVAKGVAMQIASMKPQYINRDAVPAEVVEKETKIATEQLIAEGKPENIISKIVPGKVAKALQEVCLVDMKYILDGATKVSDVLKNANMNAVSFTLYVVGEGIEKKQDNWVEEVQAALKG